MGFNLDCKFSSVGLVKLMPTIWISTHKIKTNKKSSKLVQSNITIPLLISLNSMIRIKRVQEIYSNNCIIILYWIGSKLKSQIDLQITTNIILRPNFQTLPKFDWAEATRQNNKIFSDGWFRKEASKQVQVQLRR